QGWSDGGKSVQAKWTQFVKWMTKRKVPLPTTSAWDVAAFLQVLKERGVTHAYACTFVSAINWILSARWGNHAAKSPLVTNMVKGLKRLRLQLLQYTEFWDPEVVINHIRKSLLKLLLELFFSPVFFCVSRSLFPCVLAAPPPPPWSPLSSLFTL